MAKIKLGSRPKSFSKVVKFPMLDGSTGAINVTFKYRTRTEFGEFIDALLAGAEKSPEGAEFSMEELMHKAAGSNADYLLQVIEAWDLDEDLNRANLQQLSDEVPAAVVAIMDIYRSACTEGRLGN
jgi:hypothetical protein